MKQIWSKIQKMLLWKPDMRLVAAVSVLAVLLLMIPLARYVLYSVPWYDDYLYGRFVKANLEQEYSLSSGVQGAVLSTKTEWYAFQGTFSSIFFMSIAPYAWNEDLYYLGPEFLIAISVISVFVLVGVLLKGILKADTASCIIIQSVAAAVVMVFIYSFQQGYIWYNGGLHYVGMHSFFLLTAAAWSMLLADKGKINTAFCLVWSLMGAVLAGGANYVTALQGLLLILSLVALGICLRRKRTLLLLPSLIVYAIAFYYNVSAPGNDRRYAIYDDSGLTMGAFEAVWRSFVEAFRYMWEFTGVRMLAAMVLLLPVIWLMLRKVEFRFRFPGILLLWSFCFYATGFTPSLYVMGDGGVSRTLNIVKINWQLLLLLNEVYWLGWFQQRNRREKKSAGLFQKLCGAIGNLKGIPISFYAVMGLIMLGIFALEPLQATNYSTFCAYWFVHTGEAEAFHNEYLARIDTIKNGGSVVVVTPYVFRNPLCTEDLSEDPENGPNRAIAVWYGKEAVICRKAEAE